MKTSSRRTCISRVHQGETICRFSWGRWKKYSSIKCGPRSLRALKNSFSAALRRLVATSYLLRHSRMACSHRSVANWQAAKPSTESRGSHKIVIIPVQGVLTKDGPSWLGSSYDTITEAAEKAAADPAVKRVVLAVDSPGCVYLRHPARTAANANLRPSDAGTA